MRALTASAALLGLVISSGAQERELILDMHMHALAAHQQGPPPLAVCTPFPSTRRGILQRRTPSGSSRDSRNLRARFRSGRRSPTTNFVDAGFTNRVMFGSDQMVWPGTIERAIAAIEEAPFLSSKQKRDIFYNNAARFLRLSPQDIARHRSF